MMARSRELSPQPALEVNGPMEDSTAHVQAMADLLGLIEDAIEASGRFSRDNAIGSFRTSMTLLVSVAGGPDDGLQLDVILTGAPPRQVP
jgi:hypothetical protein